MYNTKSDRWFEYKVLLFFGLSYADCHTCLTWLPGAKKNHLTKCRCSSFYAVMTWHVWLLFHTLPYDCMQHLLWGVCCFLCDKWRTKSLQKLIFLFNKFELKNVSYSFHVSLFCSCMSLKQHCIACCLKHCAKYMYYLEVINDICTASCVIPG